MSDNNNESKAAEMQPNITLTPTTEHQTAAEQLESAQCITEVFDELMDAVTNALKTLNENLLSMCLDNPRFRYLDYHNLLIEVRESTAELSAAPRSAYMQEVLRQNDSMDEEFRKILACAAHTQKHMLDVWQDYDTNNSAAAADWQEVSKDTLPDLLRDASGAVVGIACKEGGINAE